MCTPDTVWILKVPPEMNFLLYNFRQVLKVCLSVTAEGLSLLGYHCYLSLCKMAFWLVRVKFFIFTALNPHLKRSTSPKQSCPHKLYVLKVWACVQNSLWKSMHSLGGIGGWSSWRVCAELAALRLLGFIRKVKNSSVIYIVVLLTGQFSLNYNSKIHIAITLSFFCLTRDID